MTVNYAVDMFWMTKKRLNSGTAIIKRTTLVLEGSSKLAKLHARACFPDFLATIYLLSTIHLVFGISKALFFTGIRKAILGPPHGCGDAQGGGEDYPLFVVDSLELIITAVAIYCESSI